MNIKRDLGIIVSTALIVSGLFIANDSLGSITERSSVKIIKIDDKNEIRIVEGTKYRCTIVK